MNTFSLLYSLRKYLQESLAGFTLPVHPADPGIKKTKEESSTPKIFIGSLPPLSPDVLSLAPFIVIQAPRGYDENGLHNMNIVFRICVAYEDYEDAENDLHNLVSAIRYYLLKLPDGVLDRYFRLAESQDGLLPWIRPDEQAEPFLQALINSNWETASANMLMKV